MSTDALDIFMGSGPNLKIGDVEVSASLQEIHGFDADITEYPVENGSNIADHIRYRPKEVDIEAIVSNVAIETGYPGQSTFEAFKTKSEEDPALEAWHTISRYAETKTLIGIVTSLTSYDSMAITKFKVTRDAKYGKNAIRFSLTARQIIIVSTETTEAIKIPEPKNKSAKNKAKNKGKKNNEKTESETVKSKSLASMLLGGF